MKLNKKNALMIWENLYGNQDYVKDFHGNLMYKNAYGNRDFYINSGFHKIFCGWNLHHILPKDLGGTNHQSNLLCTNILTNEKASNKTTFWIDDKLYQVQKIDGFYEIVKINNNYRTLGSGFNVITIDGITGKIINPAPYNYLRFF